MRKSLISIFLLLIFIGCKSSSEKTIDNSENISISSTILNGGKYQRTEKNTQKNLTPKLFSISKSKLNIESNQIAILDLFINDSNYIWYSTNILTDEFYRFISDKNFGLTIFEKLEKSDIKTELELLKS